MMNSSRGRTSPCCWISGRSGAARAAWCPRSSREIAAAPPEIAVGKVNVDEEPTLAQAFRVQSIPMLVLLRDNAVVAAAVGAQSKEQLEQKLGL